MFRNLAIAIVSVCAVSTGSPAWSQNTQDQPDLPPSVDQQFTQSDIGTLRENCQKRLTRNNQQLYCTGEEARLLFKILNEFKTTEAVAVDGTRWLQRLRPQHTLCWAREASDGKDFIVSMSYVCTLYYP